MPASSCARFDPVTRALSLILALLLAACAGAAKQDVTVLVAPGSSLKAAANMLEDQGAIGSSSQFLRNAKLFGSDDPIKPGEYKIIKGMSDADVLALLQSGKTLQRFFTVPEGMPSILVQERLMAVPMLQGNVAVPAEGSILPDSYAYQRGEARGAVMKRMQAAMTKTLAILWAERKPTTVAKTPQEAVTLAAIVEKETGIAAERRQVAGVYSNRVRLGMKLQADPTFIYPITQGRPLGHRPRRSEVYAVNPYNTYVISGLPVGPITNPGKASLAAVLDPASTRALYFVADGSGGHVFADTLDQHHSNVKKWFALRKAKGEM